MLYLLFLMEYYNNLQFKTNTILIVTLINPLLSLDILNIYRPIYTMNVPTHGPVSSWLSLWANYLILRPSSGKSYHF